MLSVFPAVLQPRLPAGAAEERLISRPWLGGIAAALPRNLPAMAGLPFAVLHGVHRADI